MILMLSFADCCCHVVISTCVKKLSAEVQKLYLNGWTSNLYNDCDPIFTKTQFHLALLFAFVISGKFLQIMADDGHLNA